MLIEAPLRRNLVVYALKTTLSIAVLKRSYGRLVDQQTRMGINHIDKLDFLAAYPRAREDAFQGRSIYNAFKATGLTPLNGAEVLKRLNIQLHPPTPDRPLS